MLEVGYFGRRYVYFNGILKKANQLDAQKWKDFGEIASSTVV